MGERSQIRDRAAALDQSDELATFRKQFHIPRTADGDEVVYLSGNSLGLQPVAVQADVEELLEAWATRGVAGHFAGRRPWAPFHELFTDPMADLVGAEPAETVVMNSLTVNLHLLMVSFYRPDADRFRIMIEGHAFPSDHYAVESHIRFHGYDPEQALVVVEPRPGEELLRADDVLEAIERHGDTLALVLLPGVQYYTGQVFPMADIAAAARNAGAAVGFDLAHAAGNIELSLHDWNPDFAVWCTYKYLNGGPGATGAAFVHARHLADTNLPRFAGWWGHNKETRFEMDTRFEPIPTAEGWQVSNAPVLSMAPLLSALRLHGEAGMRRLRAKSERLTGFLESALTERLDGRISIVTPVDPDQRGCQLSLKLSDDAAASRRVFEALDTSPVECDWRYPNVVRVAPVPLYNSFADVADFVDVLEEAIA